MKLAGFAFALTAMGDHNDAIDDFDAALAADPLDLHIFAARGTAKAGDLSGNEVTADDEIVVSGACETRLAVAEWNRFTRHDAAAAEALYRKIVAACPPSVYVAAAQAMLSRPAPNLPR